MITLAIFSPNKNVYSETFIQAHKNLPFNIKFYYGGYLPSGLEGEADILKLSFFERIKRRLLRGFSFQEKKILFSLRKEKVNCVLAEYGITAAESLKIVKHLQLPLIVHFHGFDASIKNLIDTYKEKYKSVFNYASGVIVVSSKMQSDLISLGCPKQKIIINPCGPNDSFFKIVPDYKNLQFISVGRFVEKKAPYLTIFSFKKVVEQFPSAKLIMVGTGDLLNICKDLVHCLKLDNNIEFRGICTPVEVKELFKKSLAFVQHSITAENGDSEGTPVAVLEAQAASLPVIATLHAGIQDVVINNESGFLVEEKDIERMAQNMIRVITETGLAKKMGAIGRNRVEQNFSMDIHLKLIEDLINKSIN